MTQISFSIYQHKTYRLVTLYRGSLVSLIFDKTLSANSSTLDNAEAITLMSADVDRITSSMRVIHEVYASVIEIGIALWLLYNFLGIAMVASISWILGKTPLQLRFQKLTYASLSPFGNTFC